MDFVVDALRPLRINSREHAYIIVECGAHRPCGAVEPEFARSGRYDLQRAANQLAPEFMELLHPRGEVAIPVDVLRPHGLLPFLHRLTEALVILEDALREWFGFGNVGR